MGSVLLAAFEARQEGEQISGGTVSVGDGRTLDVAAALNKREDGVIVVPVDSPEETALNAYPALKRTSVPEDAQAAADAEAQAEAGATANATEAAARKAAELGVDLSEIDGSGSGGKITVDDVEAAAAAEAETGNGEES